jgi:acetyltransferase-like isoleucine patch superfamily enzyme
MIPGDWCEIGIPDNAIMHETALIECSLCFDLWRSMRPAGLEMAEGAGIYHGAILDVGVNGRLNLGRCAILTAAVVVCDELVEIGDYALISWNVIIMDTRRAALGASARRGELTRLPHNHRRRPSDDSVSARPVRIGSNVWIGFDSVILPGVSIGEGSIVGCRSVVADDVPPYTIVGGNPARIIKRLDRTEAHDAH